MINDSKQKLLKEIARYEKLARSERQPKKKFELANQVQFLTKQLKELTQL